MSFMSQNILPMFSSKFHSSGLTFRSLIHFEFIFVCGVRCSKFILLHVVDQFSQHHFLKRLSFLHCLFYFSSFVKSKVNRGVWIYLSILFCLSIFLFLCQYHTVLMTVTVQYSLKSVKLIPHILYFFLKVALAIQDLLCFHTSYEIIFSSSVKNTFGCSTKIALSLQIALGLMVIFTILILLIQEHCIALHLFVSSLISFISAL